jgi:class 3 adenylate cyclase
VLSGGTYCGWVLSETRYACHGDLQIAYRTTGERSRDIVFVSNWFSSCEVLPDVPSMQGWIEGMSHLGRVIFFDQPGTGASDPLSLDSLPTLEQWSDTITAVLDELKSQSAVLVTFDGAFATGALFAATHPRRTLALVVLDGYAFPLQNENGNDFTEAFVSMWGTGEMQHVMNPDMPWSEEIRAAWARQERLAASPKTLRLMLPVVAQQDVRDILPTIRVPTLVLHHADNEIIPPEQGRYIADHVQSAKYVELAGRDMYHFVEPSARRCVDEISEFLTGERAPLDDDRVLATVLFTDIVDSTRRAAEMGDHDWKGLLDAHDAVVRAQLARFRGREVNTSGDSFLATFDGPQRAIRCAMSIRDAVLPLGLEVRAGLHSGECELRGDDIGGISVHIGARVCNLAGPSEVLVSGTLRDLVIGSGLEFDERGVHQLKGVPGDWRVFALAASQR